MTREQKLEEALRAALLWTDEECDVSEWRAAAEAALAAGEEAGGVKTPKQFLCTEDGEFNGNTIDEAKPVSDIVPDTCTGTSLAFSEGVLYVNKDGSGYIAVDERHWELEDDRCEGPDGPEGSVHWITRFPSGELEVLRDFLNGVPISPSPIVDDARKFRLGDRVTKVKGAKWTGRVVGFYSTNLTPIGYAIESENEPGSVQIYPEAALSEAREGGE